MRPPPVPNSRVLRWSAALLASATVWVMGEAFAFRPMPGIEMPDTQAIIIQMEANR